MKKKKKNLYSGMAAIIIVVAVVAGGFFDTVVAKSRNVSANEPFYEWISVFERVMQRVRFGYVEEINDSLLMRRAIDGALGVLDPHTTFFDQRDYENLRLHTEGRYGGLGMLISIRNNVLTIMSPYEGTPAERAGLRSGDRILRIDGTSTRGMGSDRAASLMRGTPGTNVTLTIQREGQEQNEITITREIINIRSVPFAGLLNDSVGYIRLNSFSQTAATEVARNIDSLRALGMRSLIFDLRSNPGGLLNQAGEISELFLERGRLVVFTQGRAGVREQQFFTRRDPHVPLDMPLVILVNRGSASASEIVAGAVQDWDRGLILGDTTFGKGSVQSVFPIDEIRHMKMTTAFYYTPSGRCINRPENNRRNTGEEEEEYDDPSMNEADKLLDEEARATAAVAKEEAKDTAQEVFFTHNGRRVFGGGGIIPDTIVRATPLPYIVQRIFANDMFFRFANFYYPVLENNNTPVDTNFVITPAIITSFFNFLDSMQQDYGTLADRKYRDFKAYLGLVQDTTIDSASLAQHRITFSGADSVRLVAIIAELDKMMETNRNARLKAETKIISRHLRNAFLVRAFGQDNSFVQRQRLTHDEQLEAALRILSDRNKYNALLGIENTRDQRRSRR
ncbi:MAG: S41 family peptidase [Chitinivibrionia bacterium]|nr:S41 family peptidase [Chitinivibrionia bacterium]